MKLNESGVRPVSECPWIESRQRLLKQYWLTGKNFGRNLRHLCSKAQDIVMDSCRPMALTSCMFFPPIVMNHQHQQQMAPSSLSQQNHPTQNPPAGLMSMPNALTTQQQHQQKLRLQRIQMERERIRMRQEELMRQVRPFMVPGGVCGLCCQSYWIGSC